MTPTIDDIIHGPVFQNDPILGGLLRQADRCTDGILYSTWIMERKMDYISPLCIEITGYAPNDFITGSADFVFNIMSEEALPAVVQRQIEYIKKCKDPLFDPYTEVLEEFVTPLKSSKGRVIPLISQVTVLLFRDNADIEYSIGMICKPDEKSMATCKALLQAIKKRHNQIYEHPHFTHQHDALNLVHLTSERIDKKITTREAEVLSHLANGHSTDEIATALGISPHTVETHRKNLLLKLKAKNSAELIKKASKVFWLE